MYTYICRDCEQPFEKKLRMSQSSDTQECPTCGSGDTRKTIGKIAIGGMSHSAAPVVSAPPVSSPFT
jgi:putative FmdB family regulatory protein